MIHVAQNRNMLAGIMSAAWGLSLQFMKDWLATASPGSATIAAYLISLALSSHLRPFHFPILMTLLIT